MFKNFFNQSKRFFFGNSSPRVNPCLVVGDYLFNPVFKCGLSGWGFDSKYPAEVTLNTDGSVHLQALSDFGSIVPDNDVFPVGNYIWSVDVRNISGPCKMSWRNLSGTWFNKTLDVGDGIYTVTINSAISEFHLGANGNASSSLDCYSYSLKDVV